MVLIRQELVLRENSRLLAEQARRESEERFSALAANSSDAVVLVDRDGVVTDATPAVVRVLGLDSSQLVGRPISRLVHGDDAERSRRSSRMWRPGDPSPSQSSGACWM